MPVVLAPVNDDLAIAAGRAVVLAAVQARDPGDRDTLSQRRTAVQGALDTLLT